MVRRLTASAARIFHYLESAIPLQIYCKHHWIPSRFPGKGLQVCLVVLWFPGNMSQESHDWCLVVENFLHRQCSVASCCLSQPAMIFCHLLWTGRLQCYGYPCKHSRRLVPQCDGSMSNPSHYSGRLRQLRHWPKHVLTGLPYRQKSNRFADAGFILETKLHR